MALFRLLVVCALLAVAAALLVGDICECDESKGRPECSEYDNDKYKEPDYRKRRADFKKCLDAHGNAGESLSDALGDDYDRKDKRQRADAKKALAGAYKGLKEANEERAKSKDQLEKM
eukprot:gnl/TRDRNA2_/TRDRNA2_182274_c0_seq1.p2 gnl/TRDRNA2_/TRDRNA2_182274_c0~~gnl/TRDRNA2_/TRDRNA2_182274_c0_seq1.p2  ORF type:complete len:118 (-),score=36.70 gnl/TRDRNA2_/TRDRNA2_182274_c0_seq1:105-458(-)